MSPGPLRHAQGHDHLTAPQATIPSQANREPALCRLYYRPDVVAIVNIQLHRLESAATQLPEVDQVIRLASGPPLHLLRLSGH